MVDRIKHPQKLGDRLRDPDEHDLSLVALFEGWPTDLERLHSSLARHLRCDWELVVVDLPTDEEASERIAGLDHLVHVPLKERMGWAAARNLGLRQATGRVVAVVDTSVELTDDISSVLEQRLGEERVGLVGRWGLVTSNGFDFEESDHGDVDGVEAYFMALRREILAEAGLFNPRFKWYRNADLDFSFQVRDAGYRTIVDTSLPLRRHEHRLWSTTPESAREEPSRKNFFRFRDHWGERTDLFVALTRR